MTGRSDETFSCGVKHAIKKCDGGRLTLPSALR